MKSLVEALISKKNIKNIVTSIKNKFGITEKDLIGELKGFPIGVVVRMLEEQEKQGNKPDVKVFQKSKFANKPKGGFDFDETEAGMFFWEGVLNKKDFYTFYESYPEYEKYDK